MEHRHLLPEEIDLLLDGEVGFGVAPLKSHIDKCAECRAELASARRFVAELEHLPHLAPSPLFAERVMAQVQVIEPVHVAAAETVRRWAPESRALRVFAGAAAVAVATVLSVVSLWIVGNLDSVLFFGQVALDRTRTALLTGLGSALAGTMGEPALDAVRTGGPLMIGGIAAAFLIVVAGSALGLRALASASRRDRA